VVLLEAGPHAGHIAVIKIIDHNKEVIDGPTTGVPRQAFPYRHLTLTPLTVPKLPRSASSGIVKKHAEVVAKWDQRYGRRSVLRQRSGEHSPTLSASRTWRTKSHGVIRCARYSRPQGMNFQRDIRVTG
ncbi:hypothetical protein BGW80DRAFT_1487190, partial [Lactifluus volemus]